MLYKIFYIEALTQLFLRINCLYQNDLRPDQQIMVLNNSKKTQRAKPSEISCFKTISKWIKKGSFI